MLDQFLRLIIFTSGRSCSHMSVADFDEFQTELQDSFLHLDTIELDTTGFSISQNIKDVMKDKKMELMIKTQSSGFIKVVTS